MPACHVLALRLTGLRKVLWRGALSPGMANWSKRDAVWADTLSLTNSLSLLMGAGVAEGVRELSLTFDTWSPCVTPELMRPVAMLANLEVGGCSRSTSQQLELTQSTRD